MASENIKELERPENLVAQFVPLPATERAQGLNLGVHPTQPVVAYGSGRYVIVRSLDDPNDCMVYRGHAADVHVAKFSPTGAYVASGDANGVIRIWAYTHPERLLKGQSGLAGAVRDIAWGPESKRVCAAGDGSTLFARAFQYDSGSNLGELTGPQKRLTSCDMRQARPYRLALASEDHKSYFYEGPPFRFSTSQAVHSNFVNALRFSPSGDHFATASSDKNVFLFDGRTGEQTSQLPQAHQGSIYSLSWSPDGARLATCGADKTVKLWDFEAQAVMASFNVSASPQVFDMQQAVAFAGPHLISVSLSGDFNFFEEGNTDAPARVLTGHQTPCDAIAVDGEAGIVYSGGRDGTVCSWTGGVAQRFQGSLPRSVAAHGGKIVGAAVVGGELYTVGWDDKLRIAPRDTGVFAGEVGLTGQPVGLGVNLAQQTVVIPTTRCVHVVRAGAIAHTLEGIAYSPACAAVSDSHVAVGAAENTVYLYTLAADGSLAADGEITLRGAVSSVAFSPDGTQLAVGDANRNVTVWDVASKEAVVNGSWCFHTTRITAVAWLDADRIVSVGLDDNVFVWSLANRRTKLHVPFAHKDGVHAVAVLNAETVVTAGGDGAINTWSFPVSS